MTRCDEKKIKGKYIQLQCTKGKQKVESLNYVIQSPFFCVEKGVWEAEKKK